ncbi:hypothetical protein Apa02nite_093240 [Actinoplanes palleronii]|uniref:Uncharacterized protein n=1 Tax=Actinoplanes palleronii TaxID=113570 RepID=A0ABQ4BRC0_9ACTN|nr:hypothetical protein Apa02nite_093240 [Actinoplanes palleronii]
MGRWSDDEEAAFVTQTLLNRADRDEPVDVAILRAETATDGGHG